jgi:hypothetical protein
LFPQPAVDQVRLAVIRRDDVVPATDSGRPVAVDPILARPAVDRVVGVVTNQVVVAALTVDRVVLRVAVERVVAVTTVQEVVELAAEDRVVAGARVHGVRNALVVRKPVVAVAEVGLDAAVPGARDGRGSLLLAAGAGRDPCGVLDGVAEAGDVDADVVRLAGGSSDVEDRARDGRRRSGAGRGRDEPNDAQCRQTHCERSLHLRVPLSPGASSSGLWWAA